ncbi:hypothetical protein MKW98_002901 [Papaver atlanticum]|uniref:SHSP domain-containing protein n=1 Tax=Papaver atlanticum TaxID=357466 RepID=A0AAD4XWT7_9MAGN|nr:hypothetical protein MKW98_002901 [Papaver atlanticum]
MAFRIIDFKDPIFSGLHNMFYASDHDVEKSVNTPSKMYVRDAKAMAATPADIKEYPDSYVFVQVEENNVLVVTGTRQREEEKEKEVKYNANVDGISAVCVDGVLTITVQKLPPPEPKKPRTIHVLTSFGSIKMSVQNECILCVLFSFRGVCFVGRK